MILRRVSSVFIVVSVIIVLPTTLRANYSKEEVRMVEMFLSSRGFDTGKIDGIVSAKTALAVKTYQGLLGIPETGQITDDLIAHILKKNTREPPVSGSQRAVSAKPVKSDGKLLKAQRILKDLGYYGAVVDGLDGPKTRQAMRFVRHDYGRILDSQIKNDDLDFLEEIKRDMADSSTFDADEVTRLASALHALGYYARPVATMYDQELRRAIIKFYADQRQEGPTLPTKELVQRVRSAGLKRTNESGRQADDRLARALSGLPVFADVLDRVHYQYGFGIDDDIRSAAEILEESRSSISSVASKLSEISGSGEAVCSTDPVLAYDLSDRLGEYYQDTAWFISAMNERINGVIGRIDQANQSRENQAVREILSDNKDSMTAHSRFIREFGAKLLEDAGNLARIGRELESLRRAFC